MTLHCPLCGGRLKHLRRNFYEKHTQVSDDTYKCSKCNKLVDVEDRTCFEQEGEICVLLS